MPYKVLTTTNYSLFVRHSGENRPLDINKHRALVTSMKRYGFLPFPILVYRDVSGHLVVKDGQHRLNIAESLGLPVDYIVCDVDFDIAVVNCAAKGWSTLDYAQKHAENGNADYKAGLDFAARHKIGISYAFAMLAGCVNFSAVSREFQDGTWKIRDQDWAESVARLYCPMLKMSPKLKTHGFVSACMAVCRVSGFSHARMLSGADQCRDKLQSYSTREAYLEMMETIYNYHRKHLVGLKSLALMAMRDRDPAKCKTEEPAA